MPAITSIGGSNSRRKSMMNTARSLIRHVVVTNAVENKASLKQLTAVKDQIDENTNNKLKDLLNINKAGLADLEKKIKESNDKLWIKIETIDKTLVGRLSELEALFASRAATKYVEDSLKELEDRLKRIVVSFYSDGC